MQHRTLATRGERSVRYSSGRRRFPAFIAGLTLLGFAAAAGSGAAATLSLFQQFDFDMYDDVTPRNGSGDMPGRIYVPATSSPAPLVVYFHGFGDEVSKGIDKQVTGSNINNLISAAQAQGFFVYAPQTTDSWDFRYVQKTMAMVQRALDTYNIDPQRIYVTGLSMGGRGTRCSLSEYGNMLAAGVPICSSYGDQERAQPMVGKPIWAFHARDDQSVPVADSRNLVKKILQAGGWPVPAWPTSGDFFYDGQTASPLNRLRYTEWAVGGHGIWDDVFALSPMYVWLLAQTHSPVKFQVGEKMVFDFGTVTSDYDHPPNVISGVVANETHTGHHATSSRSVIPFAILATGSTCTPVSLELAQKFGGVYTTGGTTGAPYGSTVAVDGWRTNAGTDASPAISTLRIRNLEPGSNYSLKVWASDTTSDGSFNRVSHYSAGVISGTLNVLNNLTGSVTLNNVAANASGYIDLHVRGAAGTNTRYGQINVLEITRLPDSPSGGDLSEEGLTGVNVGSGSAGSGIVLGNGDWQVNGSGGGISGAADSFHYESRAVTGSFQAEVRVKSLTGTGPAPRSGIMLRDGSAANARMVYLAAATGTTYQHKARLTNGGTATSETAVGSYAYPNAWLRIVRSGDLVQLLTSIDGTTFFISGSYTISGLPATVQIGVFSSSGATGVNTQAVMSDFLVEQVVFEQFFESGTNINTYVSATTPNSGQFNNLSTEGAATAGTWQVTGGQLEIVRPSGTSSLSGAGMTRWTDLAQGDPAVLHVQCDLTISGTLTANQDIFNFAVGSLSAFQDYDGTTPSTATASDFYIRATAGNTFKYRFNGVLSGTTYNATGATHQVDWYLNISGATQYYVDPNGTSRPLQNNRASLWVNGSSLYEDAPRATAHTSTSMRDFRIRAMGKPMTLKLDNLVLSNGF